MEYLAFQWLWLQRPSLPCWLGFHQWYTCHWHEGGRFVNAPGEGVFSYRFCLRCKAPVSKLPKHRKLIGEMYNGNIRVRV